MDLESGSTRKEDTDTNKVSTRVGNGTFTYGKYSDTKGFFIGFWRENSKFRNIY